MQDCGRGDIVFGSLRSFWCFLGYGGLGGREGLEGGGFCCKSEGVVVLGILDVLGVLLVMGLGGGEG